MSALRQIADTSRRGRDTRFVPITAGAQQQTISLFDHFVGAYQQRRWHRDAQREASEAYIKSQKHEGWQLIRTSYDDCGYSGGTTNRPALQKLSADRVCIDWAILCQPRAVE
jgi:Resolvase, N terminal domain